MFVMFKFCLVRLTSKKKLSLFPSLKTSSDSSDCSENRWCTQAHILWVQRISKAGIAVMMASKTTNL
jgi:hypothetical protein